jgi:DNA-binding NarL/FixJ family response regulator
MNKISILLAEDHRLVRESIRQSLERDSDFTVVGEAGDGEQAVKMAAELKPAVVIMDIDRRPLYWYSLPMTMNNTSFRCWKPVRLVIY